MLFPFLISVLTYFFAPIQFSYEFCVVLLCLFLTQSYLFIKRVNKQSKQKIHFHLLFLITSLVTVFLYPIFIYPVSPNFFNVFEVKEVLVNKGTALCTMCLSGYMCGAVLSMKIKSKNKIPKIKARYYYSYHKYIVYLLWIVACMLLVKYVPQIGRNYGAIQKDDTLYSLLVVLYTVALLQGCLRLNHSLSLYGFIKKNIWIITPIAIVLVVYLLIGVRYTVLQIGLLTIGIYMQNTQKFSLKSFLLLCIVGVISFAYIVQTRNLKNSNTEVSLFETNSAGISPVLVMLSDMIAPAKNIYTGLDYVNKNGFLYGQTYIQALLSPIPLLPSFATSVLFDKTPVETTTQFVLSKYTEQREHRDINMYVGSNCFVDLYMNFGTIITLLCFVMFGYLAQYLFMNRDRMMCGALYVLLFSSSVFMVRDSLFSDMRIYLWTLGLLFFLSHRIKLRL